MIALDASVLIAYLNRKDPHHDRAKGILSTQDRLLAHTVTIAEVLVGPAAGGRLAQARSRLSNIGLDEADRLEGEPAALAALRADTRLKLPDCCVLLVAESVGARMATCDRRLGDVARSRGLTVLGAAP